jgi:hypothetical protein
MLMNKRRDFLRLLTVTLVGSPLIAWAENEVPVVQVYKSATCGCCSKWVDHMRAAGFAVEASNVRDVNLYKQEHGVPPQLASCHTALVDGYVVEGHVPADDVIKLLRERPEVIGIAVPGMPMGSPGMESPNPEYFETIAFNSAGPVAVFAVHKP